MKTKENKARIDRLINGILDVLRDTLKDVGDECGLKMNPYGFATVWLEDDEVWWDKTENALKMDELTELCALYETLKDTLNDLDGCDMNGDGSVKTPTNS